MFAAWGLNEYSWQFLLDLARRVCNWRQKQIIAFVSPLLSRSSQSADGMRIFGQ
jgi:hypothetical protein